MHIVSEHKIGKIAERMNNKEKQKLAENLFFISLLLPTNKA